MTFLTERCFQLLHSVTPFNNSTAACNTKKKCPKCERAFDLEVFHGLVDEHDCSQIFCRTCKGYADGPNNDCYMKVTKENPYYIPSEKEEIMKDIFEKKKKKKQKSKDKKSGEEDDLPEGKLYIFFDFECTQNTGSHVPNLVHATWECTQNTGSYVPNLLHATWECTQNTGSHVPDLLHATWECTQNTGSHVPNLLHATWECTQNTGSHVPNLLHATWECTNCMDAGLTLKSGDDFCPFCDHEGIREINFQEKDTLDHFCEWLFSESHPGAVAIAHNTKAYDSYFLLNHLVSKGIIPEVIMREDHEST